MGLLYSYMNHCNTKWQLHKKKGSYNFRCIIETSRHYGYNQSCYDIRFDPPLPPPCSQSYVVSNVVSWPMLQVLVFFCLKIHIRSNLSGKIAILKFMQYLFKFP